MYIHEAYRLLFLGALIWLSLLIGAMLVRSIIGPRITDRILSVNMMGTMIVACIMILALLLDEVYLLDVTLIYVMVSFVVVLVLAMTYIPARKKRDRELAGKEEEELARRHGLRRKPEDLPGEKEAET